MSPRDDGRLTPPPLRRLPSELVDSIPQEVERYYSPVASASRADAQPSHSYNSQGRAVVNQESLGVLLKMISMEIVEGRCNASRRNLFL